MKRYIVPETVVVKLRTHRLLSQNSVNNVDGFGLTKGSGDFGGGKADSRRGGFWDDED